MATPSPSDPRGAADTVVRSVGFIGLGDMGGAIAGRIIASGLPTVLWARRPTVLAEYKAPNVEARDTPAQLAAAVELVGICVWSDADVREVLEGDTGVIAGCRPGTVIAIHSTTRPDTCRELSAAALERGVALVDAPVSGGRPAALTGDLVVAVGGDEAQIERCRPVFETFGDLVVRVGPVGAGQYAKLINNTLFAANLAVADDALALGDAFDIDPTALVAVMNRGSGRSFGLGVAARCRGSVETKTKAVDPLRKDVGALADVAPQSRTVAPLLTDAASEAIRRLEQPPS